MAIKLTGIDPTAAADVPQKLVLLHPMTGDVIVDDDGNDCGLLMLGADSREYKRVSTRQTDAMLAGVSLTGGLKSMNQASAQKEQIERLVAVTTGWWNLDVDGSGTDTPFSIEAVERLFRRESWIVEQAEKFVNNRRNWFRPPAS